MNNYDLIVVGAGVAGMTAARIAAENHLSVALVEDAMFGGLVTNVNHLLPSLPDAPKAGADLAAELMMAAVDAGVQSVMANVSAVSRDEGAVTVVTSEGTYRANAVIVAAGAQRRKLGVPGEESFMHRGVSSCADCDGPLFKGQTVVVVGGGDSALQEAEVLSQFCASVHLVHRRERFSARPDLQAAVLNHPNVVTHTQRVVDCLEGSDALSVVNVRNLMSGERSSIQATGLFAYVGLIPNTAFMPTGTKDDNGHIRVSAGLETTMPNVFAIGAVRAGFGGALHHAVADAKLAAHAVCARGTHAT